MVPTDKGLAIRTAAGWSVVNRQRGLSNDITAAVLEDREGSVWIGLIGGGVARWLGRGDWESWKVDEGLPSDLIWSIRRDRKGALWVGTSLGLDASGRFARGPGAGPERTGLAATMSAGWPRHQMVPSGRPPSPAAWRASIRPPGRFVSRTARTDFPAIRKMCLWTGTTGCGFQPRAGCFAMTGRRYRTASSAGYAGIAKPRRMESAGRRAGDHLGHQPRRTVEPARRAVARAPPADGLLSDNPYVMALAADGSIWMRHRYDAGVERIEVSGDRIVRATAIVPADPKSVEVTAFHGFDAFGNFWRGSANGVAVRRGDTWTTFTTEDGLVWNDCDGEAFWADADGSVWLGTSGGLAHYHSGNGGPSGAAGCRSHDRAPGAHRAGPARSGWSSRP